MKFFINNHEKDSAFTLAEVLITLAVIGVVAALTLPALISKIDDITQRTAFLKQVTLLEQASKEYLNDNGGTFLGQFQVREDAVTKFLTKYYKTTKFCTERGEFSCISHTTTELNDPTKKSNWDTAVITADGTYIGVANVASKCDLSGSTCVQGSFDINGIKEPNRAGYDIFYWYLLQNKLIFYNNGRPNPLTDSENTRCIKDPNTNWDAWYNVGKGCAMRMLRGLPKWE